jgi:flagellar biosynthesis/type III secretory pathway protein FliH
MGGVIKSGNELSPHGALQSEPFNLQDMSEKANQFLDQVRRQAAALLAAARKQADQVAEEARQRGQRLALQEAEQRLQSKLQNQLSSLLPAFQKMIQDLEHSKQAWLTHWEQATVHLAVAIAERIVRRELQIRPTLTVDWVREALLLAMGSGSIKVQLHPEDHAALGDPIAQLLEQMHELGVVTVVADAEISRGGCRVLTQFGEVDQRLETQLARIEEDLGCEGM